MTLASQRSSAAAKFGRRQRLRRPPRRWQARHARRPNAGQGDVQGPTQQTPSNLQQDGRCGVRPVYHVRARTQATSGTSPKPHPEDSRTPAPAPMETYQQRIEREMEEHAARGGGAMIGRTSTPGLNQPRLKPTTSFPPIPETSTLKLQYSLNKTCAK